MLPLTPSTAPRRLAACSARAWLLAVGLVATAAAQANEAAPSCPATRHAANFIVGADVSTLPAVERGGARFSTAEGRPGSALQILRASGVNWARLRLWHTPVNAADVIEDGRLISRAGDPVGGGDNGLPLTIALAKRLKAQGLKWLLDFHYSDFWTDPGKQHKPAAWTRLHGAELAAEVERYTAEVLTALHAAGADPDMVQVGNEVNGGMLWPDGKTWRETPTETIGGTAAFHELLRAGIRGVRATDALRGTRTPVMLHLAHTGDGKSAELLRTVYDGFEAARLDYDLIGLSWYAYFHDPIAQLRSNLRMLSDRYGKPLVIVETAYGYQLDNPDGGPAVFNAEGAKRSGVPATPEGQAQLLREVVQAVASVPQGLGVFYWEPAWVSARGAGWRTGEGNGWANQALFDAQGRALPALRALRAAAPPGRCP